MIAQMVAIKFVCVYVSRSVSELLFGTLESSGVQVPNLWLTL